MSDLHTLELRTPVKGKPFAAGNAEILLDGKPLAGVVSIVFEAAVDQVARATIVLNVAELKAERVEVKTKP